MRKRQEEELAEIKAMLRELRQAVGEVRVQVADLAERTQAQPRKVKSEAPVKEERRRAKEATKRERANRATPAGVKRRRPEAVAPTAPAQDDDAAAGSSE
jgi:hypothetical protein